MKWLSSQGTRAVVEVLRCVGWRQEGKLFPSDLSSAKSLWCFQQPEDMKVMSHLIPLALNDRHGLCPALFLSPFSLHAPFLLSNLQMGLNFGTLLVWGLWTLDSGFLDEGDGKLPQSFLLWFVNTEAMGQIGWKQFPGTKLEVPLGYNNILL